MSEWIQWQGGNSDKGPLGDHVWCEIMMADGEIWQEFAGEVVWCAMDEPGEIIAYRVLDLQDAPIMKEEVEA